MSLFDKTKELGNGKIIITDFAKLRPEDFIPIHVLNQKEILKEMFLCSPDGKIYCNSKFEEAKIIAEAFDTLTKESRYGLEQYKKNIKKQFPQIKKMEDLESLTIDSEKSLCLIGFLIPIEYKRRDLERAYYKK